MCYDIDPDTGIGTCVELCSGTLSNPACPITNHECKLLNDGILPIIYAQITSLELMRHIFGRQEQQGKMPSEREAALNAVEFDWKSAADGRLESKRGREDIPTRLRQQ